MDRTISVDSKYDHNQASLSPPTMILSNQMQTKIMINEETWQPILTKPASHLHTAIFYSFFNISQNTVVKNPLKNPHPTESQQPNQNIVSKVHTCPQCGRFIFSRDLNRAGAYICASTRFSCIDICIDISSKK